FAPVFRRERAIPLPGAPAQLQGAAAVSRDPEEAQERRFHRTMLRQRELPPQPIDASEGPLILDGLPELLVDDPNLGSGRLLPVQDAGETEEVAGKLRAARGEDEGAAHSEDPAEESGLEDHVVAGGSLTRSLRGR